MKFGFIAHPVNQEELELIKTVKTLQNFPFRFSPHRVDSNKIGKDHSFFTFSKIKSLSRDVCSGRVNYLPLLPEEIVSNQTESFEKILMIARELVDWGAEIIGLGGFTSIAGARGIEIQKHLPVPVTTGNSYTVYTCLEALERICTRLKIELQSEKVIIIGFPGSIGFAVARCLIKRGVRDMLLVGRRNKAYLEKMREKLKVLPGMKIDFSDDIPQSITRGRLILSATTTGEIIPQSMLLPGTVVIDIAYPRDVIGNKPERQDVMIVDGGRFNVHPEVTSENFFGNIIKNNFYGCLGEVALLALEKRSESFSLGRELNSDKIEEIGRLSVKHGFCTDVIYSFGYPVEEVTWSNIKKILFRESEAQPGEGKGLISAAEAAKASKEEVYQRCESYTNPIMAEMAKLGNFDKSFVKASGIHLWDHQGTQYYDFIGGYGSVNIGHHHPRIQETIKNFLEQGIPSLLQAAPGMMTTALAENLARITPENLSVTFFCNSGTEANEGALKLARINTGRSKFVYTDNSFHGKSFGSLSVTGREKYQQHFQPLLPGCEKVDFGDTEQLEALLKNEDVAAFIVEPIQGEGGVIIPPAGYLKTVSKLCKKYNTLLILDEVQTGFGRTGKMFALEYEKIQPDILTVAKSLGGGILPIGAYITTPAIWESAYGSYDRFLLHTSTFGGNNFAAAVALTTLQIIYDEKLIKNAERMGHYFLEQLKRLQEKYEFISDVRGRGLMIGIEFNRPLDVGWNKMILDIQQMMSGDIVNLLKMVPRDLRLLVESTLEKISQQLKKTVAENFSRTISSHLLNQHRILTLVTLNNPNVMRVQPPLTLLKEQVDYFIDSLDKVCKDVDISLPTVSL